LWGNCPPSSKTCGIANALQFSSGQNGQTWFTEWSENKIGSLGTNYKQLPFSVSVLPQELTIKGGQTVEVKVNISATTTRLSQNHSDSTVEMLVSGTVTQEGGLGNSTGTYSQESFPMQDLQRGKQLSFIFTPATNLKPGEYMLMLGAQNNEVGMLKAIKVHIIR
jgi:virginiamycin B lyase